MSAVSDDMRDRVAEALCDRMPERGQTEDDPCPCDDLADAVLPLIAEARAAGAAEVRERVETAVVPFPGPNRSDYERGFNACLDAVSAALDGDQP